MIFKVMYQELPNEIPVRERTKSLYFEAQSQREVRQKLSDRSINIEFIQQLDDAHLAYEKNSPNFKVENAS
ncbi:DNA-directed RNA polymerase subunit epsilon [Aquibacillus sp. 3ASR75-11]|uniref:DNA-directed RNA polymerase subunit epsilon n=1 Tax=Terrihalobacillus insolitus TaxID=2950438 RepID=A0A9X3WUX1_9BACI|nr:DNA-directed RNA polymerase subunit epsilon [Terrihalobacillus insolitus]MDC3412769.1 DNA-directed RNA polymerase subunit epsilon [Terrihalobacillus insolitus]MDC3423754.1 DNA-directed RNA polymerase subunit epsilon [Terrihalobacillus insolitus]